MRLLLARFTYVIDFSYKDWGSKFLRKVNNRLQDCTGSQPIRGPLNVSIESVQVFYWHKIGLFFNILSLPRLCTPMRTDIILRSNSNYILLNESNMRLWDIIDPICDSRDIYTSLVYHENMLPLSRQMPFLFTEYWD